MNLFSFINKGAQSAIADRQNHLAKQELAALERARTQWLDALMTDETRAWMEIGQESREVLSGLATLLTLAGLAKAYDTGDIDAPDVRIIRGAISAAEQCGLEGSVLTAEHAAAFSSAATRAKAILANCTTVAIKAAAQGLHNEVHGGG